MNDGYVVDPAVLRTVAASLRDRATTNGTPATYGLDAGVDAGRSTGEVGAATAWLAGELEKLRESLSALGDNLQGVADRYVATDEASAGDYTGAASSVSPFVTGVPQ